MTDNSEPLDDANISIDDQEDIESDSENESEPDQQEMFEQKFDKLMSGFGKACEEENVEAAIAIAKIDGTDRPMVFYRGQLLDAASLMASVLREIKEDIFNSLDTEPRQ